eukprot:355214-Chlamydomonas_euryale.AAC.8
MCNVVGVGGGWACVAGGVTSGRGRHESKREGVLARAVARQVGSCTEQRIAFSWSNDGKRTPKHSTRWEAHDGKHSAGGCDGKHSAGGCDGKHSAGGCDGKHSAGVCDGKHSAGGCDRKHSA